MTFKVILPLPWLSYLSLIKSVNPYFIEMPFNTFANRADPDQELPDQCLLCLLMEI